MTCTLAAVLIVKNEEVLLDRCLSSLVGVDDIVVCDTGSTDKTVEIAEAHNVTVVRFEWCDDFAAARNYAKQHTDCTWVLSIDADEVLAEGGVAAARAAIAETSGQAVAVRLVAEGSGDEHWVPRLFRREVDWVGRVHELPEAVAQGGSDVSITYGYSPAHLDDPDRVLRILLAIEDPTPRDLYYLSREYFYRAQWEKAVATLDVYLGRAAWMPERAAR
jgi:glycosyltransferase involved in cell wall biosynthesis